MVGSGILYLATGNRSMTETALNQIGRKPHNDKCVDREGFSLAAGIALGLINLGRGHKREAIKDLQLDERLVRFVEGGRVMEPPQSMLSRSYVGETKCSAIREGQKVNTHVTAPAALIALALMHLRSNDSELAARLSIPDSFSDIEQCNPNHILLKVVARHLIMFDRIGKEFSWLKAQLPELIAFIYGHDLPEVYERYYLVYNVEEVDFGTITAVYWNVLAGTALAMALKHAGSADPLVLNSILKLYD